MKCQFRQHSICNTEQMHPPKPKVAACWWIYCCYLQKRQPSFKITTVINHFDAELSPCQAKVQAGNSRVQGKKGAAADPPKVHWWGCSCPDCHTAHLTHMHTPNKDTFCSQAHSLCNGRLLAMAKDLSKGETLTSPLVMNCKWSIPPKIYIQYETVTVRRLKIPWKDWNLQGMTMVLTLTVLLIDPNGNPVKC